MVKLFYGKDSFSLQKYLEKAIAANSEVSFFDNESIEFWTNVVLTESFFAPKRTLIVKNALTKISQEDEKRILHVLKNAPQGTDIIFLEGEEIPKNEVISYILKNGELKNFETKKAVNLVVFIKEKVAEEGGEIAPLAAERLAGFVGNDLWQLTEEIKKLVLYKRKENESEPIQTADVDLLVKSNFEANIFTFLDAIAEKNKKKATELLNSFLVSGENAIYLLTMIERQFKNIALAKFEDGVSESVLAKRAGIHPFVAKKSIKQARNFSKSEIIEFYQKFIWADLKLKSGYEPEQILLRLIG